MPVYWNATDYTQIQVQTTCENCGKDYAYVHPVGVTTTSNSRSKATSRVSEALDDEIVWLNRAIRREGFDERGWWLYRQGVGDTPCTHCGYIQSWQATVRQGRFINQLTNIVGVLMGILVFAFIVINSPLMGSDSLIIKIILGLCVATPVGAFSAVISSFLLPSIILRFYRINRAYPAITNTNKPQIAEIKATSKRY